MLWIYIYLHFTCSLHSCWAETKENVCMSECICVCVCVNGETWTENITSILLKGSYLSLDFSLNNLSTLVRHVKCCIYCCLRISSSPNLYSTLSQLQLIYLFSHTHTHTNTYNNVHIHFIYFSVLGCWAAFFVCRFVIILFFILPS